MDTEKVEKARNGNVDEIGNLLMENMKSMYRVAFSILKTEEEISDAISNTTVIVFEKIHTLKNAEFFKTWLIRILINECNKIHRQNKKIIYLENYNQTDLVYNDKYDDFGVRQAIKKLDEDLKTMVILYYFEDFNIK
jgi:RNA polymerase sigma-70 factor, ECF family